MAEGRAALQWSLPLQPRQALDGKSLLVEYCQEWTPGRSLCFLSRPHEQVRARASGENLNAGSGGLHAVGRMGRGGYGWGSYPPSSPGTAASRRRLASGQQRE